jgi:CRP-like cAMP-binding protein
VHCPRVFLSLQTICSLFHAELVKLVKGVPQDKTLKAGDCFGQEMIKDQQKYSATIVSLQTTTGWKINRAVLANNVPVDRLRMSRK